MSDDPKPTVSIGFFYIPIVSSNFSIDGKGSNQIIAEYIGFCGDVLSQTCAKLHAAAEGYFGEVGITVERLTEEEVLNYTKQLQLKMGHEVVAVSVVTPEGKVIEDEHAIEAIISGRSINN